MPLTWDRGKEMANHKRFSVAAKEQVYFCDPCSPWQRSSNENTNGLLHIIALRTPARTLGFVTPGDELRAVLLATNLHRI